MSYNLTAISHNTTGLLTFIQGVNNVLLGGQFGTMLVVALTFILGSSFFYSTGDIRKSIMATSFIIAIVSIFLRMMSLFSDFGLFVSIVICAFAIGFSFISEG